uniref:Ig-like domain-containing protein n=1 Tax=Periophthalmus magnuspinnatus TaxID=409849 RepID=A0A3B3ZPU6_9GOBI
LPKGQPGPFGTLQLFDRKLLPKEATVGDSIELECHMTGSTPIKVTWSKDHKDIRTGGNYKISFEDNTACLTIVKADKGDTGRYFCHASNDMGKDSCSAEITVKGNAERGCRGTSRLAILHWSCIFKNASFFYVVSYFSLACWPGGGACPLGDSLVKLLYIVHRPYNSNYIVYF